MFLNHYDNLDSNQINLAGIYSNALFNSHEIKYFDNEIEDEVLFFLEEKHNLQNNISNSLCIKMISSLFIIL